MPHGPLALEAPARSEIALVPVGVQGVEGAVGLNEDGAAEAAVSAIGSAAFRKLLAAEAHGPGASVACLNVEGDVIEKHGQSWVLEIEKSAQAIGRALSVVILLDQASTGSMWMNRPCWPLSWKRTLPLILAKRVWSVPMPTLTPILNLVPR